MVVSRSGGELVAQRAKGVAQRAGSRGCGRKGEGRHPGMAK